MKKGNLDKQNGENEIWGKTKRNQARNKTVFIGPYIRLAANTAKGSKCSVYLHTPLSCCLGVCVCVHMTCGYPWQQGVGTVTQNWS